jgi:hypothetical protein
VCPQTQGDSVTLTDVMQLGNRYLSADELAECYVRHEVLVAAHVRCLDAGEDLKTLDCRGCGLTQCELGVLLADSTRGPYGPEGPKLTQRGIDVVQGAAERMRAHLKSLSVDLNVELVCMVTGADQEDLEPRLAAWRSMMALGA